MREQSLGVGALRIVQPVVGWSLLSHRAARVDVIDDAVGHRLGEGDWHPSGVRVA